MKKQFIMSLFLIAALFLTVALCGAVSAVEVPQNALNTQKILNASSCSDVNSQVMDTNIPFIENQGQKDSQVKYYASTFYGTAYVTPNGITHSIQNKDNQTLVVTEQFLDDDGNVIQLNPQGEDKSQTQVSYFLGNDSQDWHTGLNTWNLINLGEIYPGITVKLKAHGGNIEKLFFVNPGANVDDIKILVSGADRLSVDPEGKLVLESKSFGNVSMTKPIAYQGHQDISAAYNINGNTYRYTVGSYDHNKQLVIDPLLSYSTYLGGSNYDGGWVMAIDSAGNTYITGITYSTDFPTKNPLQNTSKGYRDIFVTKINPQGTALVYSTYLGGTNDDYGEGIAVDGVGNAYITGYTASTDFPLQNPIQSTNYGGGTYGYDAFVAKINPQGTTLVYSTYLGGTNDDYSNEMTVDSAGNAFITGKTLSTDFPTKNPLQNTHKGYFDAFVAKINPEGTALVYSTYFGGTKGDWSNGIAVDSTGNVYIAGGTWSADLTTKNPLQNIFKGSWDVFVVKINSTGNSLIYSTYLGGTGSDNSIELAVDSSGNAYITGTTNSTDFPTQNPLQSTNHGDYDVFVTKINPQGNALVYSTYLGGTLLDDGQWIAVDSSGNVYITGKTLSTDFPTKNPIQSTNHGGYDAYVAKINSTGTALIYSTYLGGTQDDYGEGIKIDSKGNAYMVGSTFSTDFPTRNSLQPTNHGDCDIFLVKISGSVVNANTGKVFDTIQAAIDDAGTKNGHTLWLAPGTYRENVLVAKKLTIVPWPNMPGKFTVQAQDPNSPVFTINSAGNGSIIKDLKITGATSSSGIYLNSSKSCSIMGNTITGNLSGINLLNSSASINNNIILGNIKYGLENHGTGTANATNNWWGTKTPKYVNSTTAPAKCDIWRESGTVNYKPWLIMAP